MAALPTPITSPASIPAESLPAKKQATFRFIGPRKVEMFINLKTAKALGLTIPPGLVIAADEVFEWSA